MPCRDDITGLILAGGAGRRLGGRDKARMSYRGTRFIDRLLDLFRDVFCRTVVVTGDPGTFTDMPVEVAADRVPGQGAAMGLISGLDIARTEWSFVTACDTPLLQRSIVDLVLESIDDDYQVILPATPDGLQPLCAAYHKSCISLLERNLERGRKSIRPLYEDARVKVIGPDLVTAADRDRLSFININTPEDLALLRRLEEKGS